MVQQKRTWRNFWNFTKSKGLENYNGDSLDSHRTLQADSQMTMVIHWILKGFCIRFSSEFMLIYQRVHCLRLESVVAFAPEIFSKSLVWVQGWWCFLSSRLSFFSSLFSECDCECDCWFIHVCNCILVRSVKRIWNFGWSVRNARREIQFSSV